MRGIKLLLFSLALGVSVAGLTSPASATDEEMMACEAFVTLPLHCCYCDGKGNAGSCGVTTASGVMMCTPHLCPNDGEPTCVIA
jgi:hypothetical protein